MGEVEVQTGLDVELAQLVERLAQIGSVGEHRHTPHDTAPREIENAAVHAGRDAPVIRGDGARHRSLAVVAANVSPPELRPAEENGADLLADAADRFLFVQKEPLWKVALHEAEVRGNERNLEIEEKAFRTLQRECEGRQATAQRQIAGRGVAGLDWKKHPDHPIERQAVAMPRIDLRQHAHRDSKPALADSPVGASKLRAA